MGQATMHARRDRWVKLLHLLVCMSAWPVSACLDNKLDTDDVERTTEFIASTSDFAKYKDWMSFARDITSEHDGVLGTTTIYVRELPNAQKFAIGSLIVKTMQANDTNELTIHAMSKRGGTFNSTGAVGWEYFELMLNKAGTPYILWRGEKPPTGEQYRLLLGSTNTSTTTESDCNTCHDSGHDGVLGDDLNSLFTAP